MFVLSGKFADVGRTLGLHCRCLRMFPGRVTLFTDVPSLFADVLTKPADLAIGTIGPHNRDSVNRALLKSIHLVHNMIRKSHLVIIYPNSQESLESYMVFMFPNSHDKLTKSAIRSSWNLLFKITCYHTHRSSDHYYACLRR